MPKLSDTKIRSAKPRQKPYKLFDSDGLFLVVRPNGARWWRQRYHWDGKEQLLSLGTYPDIGLAAARERGGAIRKQVANGTDPSAARQADRIARLDAAANTFKAVALDWHKQFKRQWSAAHAERVLHRLETHVFPWIGSKPIGEVNPKDILACVARLRDRGVTDTTRRLLQSVKQIFAYAITHERVAVSPAAHIEPKHIMPSIDVTHRAAIKDPVQLGALLRSVETYQGSFVVRCALQFLALTFVRPGELRYAEWPEFSLDGKEPEWRIPAARMKLGDQPHIVPLSRQAVALLREIEPLTGADSKGYVFPSNRNASRPMSENTLNAALRSMGFSRDQHTAHGFRGSASTMLNEQAWHKDAIERQLAHMPRDKVRASYNSAEHLPERRRMMQAWADYLDALKAGGKVVSIRKGTGAR